MDELVQALKTVLANHYAFSLKAQNFHWNVEGADFYQLHKLFETIYDEVYGAVDDFAENIRKIKGYAPASLHRFSNLTEISDETTVLSSTEMVSALLADAEKMQEIGVQSVDGIMADLGVSSPQLDQAERGFSFMQDGPLDMRMDNSKGLTAAEWLLEIEEEQLANIIYQYGEERYSRRIAKAIKQAGKLDTTAQLAELVKTAHPKWEKHKHPATRTFQAIRIAINKELDDIEVFLPQAVDLLKPKGRLSVISFHSLEDRLIKQFIQKESTLHLVLRLRGGKRRSKKASKKASKKGSK